jgi:hypothetical protein
MSLEKALLTTDGDHVDITVPFTKANKSKRTIIGIATADAVDHAGDIVTFAASKKAFATTEAAIREQHDKGKPVGRIVNFEAKSLWDEKLNKVVNVIEVEAYISETAQDTWTKINEGILKGFSIGGNVTDSEMRISKDDPTKTYRYITDYTLTELSVVDNPCSPQAQIMTIHKSADSDISTIGGMVADVDTENVFWNASTRELKVTKDDTLAGYENIGWIETSKSLDDEVRSEQLALVLKTYQDLNKSDEGGATDMSEKNEEVVTEETVVEEVEAPVTEETVEAPSTEEVATVETEEVPAEEVSIQKMIEDLRSTIAETVEKAVSASTDTTHKSLSEVDSKLEKVSGQLVTELTALKSQHEELSKSVSDLKSKFDNVEKSIESLESDTAIKKSSDLGGSKEIRKNDGPNWGGAFSVSRLGN